METAQIESITDNHLHVFVNLEIICSKAYNYSYVESDLHR